MPAWPSASVRKCPHAERSHEGGEGVESDRELMLEDACSISEGLWRMARLAQQAAEEMDSRIETEVQRSRRLLGRTSPKWTILLIFLFSRGHAPPGGELC
jgi:hypothetical protein